MTVKTKLFLVLGVLSSVAAIIALIGLSKLSTMNDRLNTIVNKSAEKVKLATLINQNLVAISRAEKNIILAKSQEEMNDYAIIITKTREAMKIRLSKLRELVGSEDRAKLDDFAVVWGHYLGVNKQVREYARLKSNARARVISANDSRKAYENAEAAMKYIADLNYHESATVNIGDDQVDEVMIRMNNSTTRALLAARIIQDMLSVHRTEKSLILELTQEGMDRYANSINTLLMDINTKLDQLNELASDEGKIKITEFKIAWSRFKDLGEQIRTISHENGNVKAFELSTGVGRKMIDNCESLMSSIVDANAQNMSDNATLSDQDFAAARWLMLFTSVTGIGGGLLLGAFMIFGVTRSLSDLLEIADKVAAGDLTEKIHKIGSDEVGKLALSINKMIDTLNDAATQADIISSGDYTTDINPRSPKDKLGHALQRMTTSLSEISALNEKNAWISTGVNGINDLTRGATDLRVVAESVCKYLAKYLDAQILTFYVAEENSLKLMGSYAFNKRKSLGDTIEIGEGLIGQAALERQLISIVDVPEDYARINSSIGSAWPRNLVVSPFVVGEEIQGVIELGFFEELSDDKLVLLEVLKEPIGISIRSIFEQNKTSKLLEQTQEQSEVLLSQQEELQTANETLEEQMKRLKASEEALQTQSEELRVSNEELAEKTKVLEIQKTEVENARNDLEIKSEDLALASKYKSEFLANMSHELRTPLNSFLLLSKGLSDNRKGNLDEDQLEDLRIIHEGGSDLLELINDIMDLSKVEAGKLSVQIEDHDLKYTCTNIKNLFNPIAKNKGLEFEVTHENKVPKIIRTDSQRLQQILKNFLSNAFKFTSSGSVQLKIHCPEDSTRFLYSPLTLKTALALSVVDTGIGIPEDKQHDIFEAFQQQDGSTSRKYGGTGLGLTISRELAKILGGEIQLKSTLGKGSTFTLFLPLNQGYVLVNNVEEDQKGETEEAPLKTAANTPIVVQPNTVEQFIPDDRNQIAGGDHSILIIEDDINFAKVLLRIVRNQGYKGLVAGDGKNGIYMALEYKPRGIFLDLGLPDMDGNTVLEQLKFHLATKHIPVHVISGKDDDIRSRQQGAIGFLQKPADESDIERILVEIEKITSACVKNILIVEDNKNSQKAICQLIQNKGIGVECVDTGEAAVAKISSETFDTVILDIGLPDISGFEVLEKISQEKSVEMPPTIVYTGQELTQEQRSELNKYATTLVLKDADSPEKLLDEALLFMHSLTDDLSSSQKKTIYSLHDESKLLDKRKILLVDDDMRNTFALSKNLQQTGLVVFEAENGQSALNRLNEEDGIELIIMDIMMPIMDGYEAMREIRKMKQYKDIPIIALTAKAMPEDRAKCIEAGATDYLTKPVDFDKLISMIKVWLFKK